MQARSKLLGSFEQSFFARFFASKCKELVFFHKIDIGTICVKYVGAENPWNTSSSFIGSFVRPYSQVAAHLVLLWCCR